MQYKIINTKGKESQADRTFHIDGCAFKYHIFSRDAAHI